MWGHQSSGARAPELWCPLSSWLSDNVVDYLDVDGDEVGDSEGKESWLLEAPDISLSTTNPSFGSVPYFLKYFLDILFSFSCYFPQHVAFPCEQTIPLSSPLNIL